MKGISGNPALDAYQRMSVTRVNGAQRTPAAATGEAEASAPQHAAKVSISSEARTRAAGAADGQFDVQKVESLKAQVDSGTLQVDSRLVASRMLDQLA